MHALPSTLPHYLGRHAAYTGCAPLSFMPGTWSLFCGAATCCLPRRGSRLAACQKLLPGVDSCRKATSLCLQPQSSDEKICRDDFRPPSAPLLAQPHSLVLCCEPSWYARQDAGIQSWAHISAGSTSEGRTWLSWEPKGFSRSVMAIRPHATMEPITFVPSSSALSPEPQVKPLMLMEGMEPASWLVMPRATPLQPLTSSARLCQPCGSEPQRNLLPWHAARGPVACPNAAAADDDEEGTICAMANDPQGSLPAPIRQFPSIEMR